MGASSAAWAPASTARSMASIATRVLPEPTSPCSRRSMRLGAARSASISARARLARGQGMAEAGEGFGPQAAVAGEGAAGAGRSRARRSWVKAIWLGEDFVVGEAFARGVGGSSGGGLQGAERLGEAGPASRSQQGGSCHSGSAGRRGRAPARCRAATDARGEPGGEAPDRLDAGDFVDALGRHDLLRVGDNEAAGEAVQPAGQRDPGADRELRAGGRGGKARPRPRR